MLCKCRCAVWAYEYMCTCVRMHVCTWIWMCIGVAMQVCCMYVSNSGTSYLCYIVGQIHFNKHLLSTYNDQWLPQPWRGILISLDPKSLQAGRKDEHISNHVQHKIKDATCHGGTKRSIVLIYGMAGIFEINLREDGGTRDHFREKHAMSSGQRWKYRVICYASVEINTRVTALYQVKGNIWPFFTVFHRVCGDEWWKMANLWKNLTAVLGNMNFLS